MLDAPRLAVALVVLVGLVMAVLGAWFAITLGPDGTARFTATTTESLLIGPSVLNRVGAPVTVCATSGAGPVFVASTTPQDALDVVGTARHQEVVVAEFPARTLQLRPAGDGDLADPRSLQVWRATGEGCLVVSPDQAPSSVVVYPPAAGPVDVSMAWQRGAWFVQSIAVLVVGVLLLAGAGWWLRRGPQPTTGSGEVLDPTPGGDVPGDDVPGDETSDVSPGTSPAALKSGVRHDEETTR